MIKKGELVEFLIPSNKYDHLKDLKVEFTLGNIVKIKGIGKFFKQSDFIKK